MTDYKWQSEVIDEVAKFSETYIRPFAKQFEEEKAIPTSLIKAMAEKGYLGASLPIKYGGLGLDAVHYGLFTEEIGKGCSSVRSLLTVHTSLVSETLLRWGNENQKNDWLPLFATGKKIACFCLTEPEVGTDANSVKTQYKKVENGYVLKGQKKWITFGDIADVFLVIAECDGSVTAFLVEREFIGVSTSPINGLLAAKAAHIAEVYLDNVFVPESNVIGKPGSGFSYIVSTALDHGRYSIAWAGIAIAQAALEEMVTYSRTRSQFGKKIYNFQLIQAKIADAMTNIQAGRSLCLRAGELRKEKNDESIIMTTIAKYFSSKIAMEITIDAVQVFGGNGCCNVYPVERLFREAKILEIIEGTSQVLQEIISRHGLRKYYRPTSKVSSILSKYQLITENSI